ncbi:MAG TPA: hypothetical protein EYP58_03240, partial [bacterium (Candidatus Stahlbacteria)]|nr:hypothetical protein [Candidatus Stahlbacteria bacterium]
MPIFLTITVIFSAMKLTLAEIPAPSQGVLKSSKIINSENLEVEYWIMLAEGITHQEAGDQGIEVAKKYLQRLKKKGWVLLRENWQRRGCEFLFRKEVIKELKVAIGVSKKPMEGKMRDYAFVRLKLKRLIPFRDIIGCDPSDVPRYPNGTRVRYMNLLGDFAVKYLTTDPVDSVKPFFTREVPKYGWEPAKGVGTLNYQKGGVMLIEDDRKKIKERFEKLRGDVTI